MGLNLGGIMKSVINPMTLAQLAMGPAGWASIAMKAVAQQIGTQLIQTVAQQLGVPPQITNAALTAFNGANAFAGGVPGLNGNGQFSTRELANFMMDNTNMSPLEAFKFSREIGDKINDFKSEQVQNNVRRLVDQLMESEESKSAKAGAKGGKAGESILMRIAKALGSLADQKMGEMDKLATQIGATKDGKNQNKITEQGAQLQALGQEMSILSNAMTNVLKSIGEANSTVARKS